MYTMVFLTVAFGCYVLYYLCNEESRYSCYANKVIISNNNEFQLCYDNMYSKQIFRKFIPGSDAEIKAYYEIRKNGSSIFKFERASCPMECGNCHYNIALDTVTMKYIFLIDSYGSCFRLPNKSDGNIHASTIHAYYKPYYKPYFIEQYYKSNTDSLNSFRGNYSIDSLDFCGIVESFKIESNHHCFKDWKPWF